MAASRFVTHTPSFRDLVRTFAVIGFLSFGGAAGQIAMMHRVVVDEKKWLDEPRFLHALGYCMLLPGPEAQQLATYIGWLTHGVRGGLAAGLLFVLPGAVIMAGLSLLYVTAAGLPLIDGAFFGIKAAVLAIVSSAVVRLSRRSLRTGLLAALAVTVFGLIACANAPFPLLILGCALVGLLATPTAPIGPGPVDLGSSVPPARLAGARRAALAGLALWAAPVLIALALLGPDHVVTEMGLFVSRLAAFSFGGAYALLVWLSQHAVAQGWLGPREMADGLGLAETTPGPTILVTEFVAFVTAWRQPGLLSPPLAAFLAAAMTVWTLFAPSFVWIFAGAPYVERLRSNRRLAAALDAVTAGVVGVMAYLALWFGLHILFGTVEERHAGLVRFFVPDISTLDVKALGLTAVAMAAVFVWRLGLVRTVFAAALAGVGLRLLG